MPLLWVPRVYFLMFWCMCECECVYVYIYIYIWICLHGYIYRYTYHHMCVCMGVWGISLYIRVCVCVCVCVCMFWFRMKLCRYTHTHTHTHTHTKAWLVHTHTHTHTFYSPMFYWYFRRSLAYSPNTETVCLGQSTVGMSLTKHQLYVGIDSGLFLFMFYLLLSIIYNKLRFKKQRLFMGEWQPAWKAPKYMSKWL